MRLQQTMQIRRCGSCFSGLGSSFCYTVANCRTATVIFQVGLPDHAEALEAQLDYQLQTSGDVKSFLSNIAETQDLGDFSVVMGKKPCMMPMEKPWC